ncbi:hypothetical protein LTS18_014260, partial [Coniosporium uncinatum]
MALVPFRTLDRALIRRRPLSLRGVERYDDDESYDIPLRDLCRLLRPDPAAVKWDIDYATAFLVNHLTNMANEAAKLLSNTRVDNPQTHNKAHLPSQIRVPFNGVLFAGKLNKHMLMEWSHLGPEVSGRTSATGIELNIDLHFGNALRDQVLASLIHQMIHAYFLTVCSEPPDSDDPRLTHGNHFGKI